VRFEDVSENGEIHTSAGSALEGEEQAA
jgi:hypothetical protein